MQRLRVIILVLATGAALWWLYPHRETPAGDHRTEVTIWFNGLIEGRQLAVIDAFEKRFPQYRAILGSSAARTGLDGEGNPQRLMCGIAGGVPPEIVEYDRFAVCQWASRKAFLDINPLIERDQRELDDARAQLARLQADGADVEAIARQRERVEFLERYIVRAEDYYPQTWNECTWQGGQYGVPNYMDDRVLYYNADLLVQNGVVNEKGEPAPPDTWEQICRKRVDATDARIAKIDKKRARISSGSADFVAAGVRPGDTVSHISNSGVATRCVVASVDSPREITVSTAYAGRDLSLPERADQHVKIFDQASLCLRLSRWDDQGRMRVVGFEPQHGNGWLYMYGWMNGGEFLSKDGLTCTLDDPRVVEALQWTTDVYDSMGGVQDVNAFKKSFQPGAQDPFFMNQIALFINGDWFLRDLGRYARDMRFGTHPAPVPAKRITSSEPGSVSPVNAQPVTSKLTAEPAKNGRNFTWVAGFAYCIPATCPPEKLDAAWALVKFLSSVEGGMTMNEHDAQRERGQGRLYVPRLAASIPFNTAQFDTYVNIPEMPQRLRAGLQTHVDMLPFGRFRPVSPEGKKLWDGQATAQDLAWNHKHTPAEALRLQARQVQQALDRFYNPPAGAKVRWTPLIVVYGFALVLIAVVMYWRHRTRYKVPGYMRKEWRTGVLFALPWIVGFIVLSGGPMIFSAVMSFTQYDVLSDATFIGAQNYVDLATPDKDPLFLKSLGNTLFMAIGVPIGMVVGLALALLLDAKVRGMSVYRTLYFLPAIMPVVAASVLWIWVFNAQNGLMNWMLQLTGIEAIIEHLNRQFDIGLKTPISWLTSEQTAKPALIIMGLWGAGASMIIWLAGLKEIPTHLYEAAALDGAGPVRRFFHITLPMLSPYILFNLVMGLIGTFQIFTQAYIMTPNGSPSHSTYFYVYKLFDESFSYFRLGYGAAMAWVLFVIVIVLTLFNMALSKKWVHYGGE
jgi:multiple sugar transport system permease protein